MRFNKIRMPSYVLISFISLIFLVASGCATIPKESVSLSKEIGNGIVSQQSAYVNLLNNYFALKRQAIDDFIEKEYLPAYIKNIQAKLQAAKEKLDSFDSKMLSDIVAKIIQKRDGMQRDLDHVRVHILEKVNEEHVHLLRANTSITALLQSAVDVKQASVSAGETVKKITGGRIDLEEIEKKFNEYLMKSGDLSSKAEDLFDLIKPLINKKGGDSL
ncbi:MAG: hypothetical protein HZA00_10810 [Nitrospinae bacterium]|nr:hypothetical protein [Nitrospinota bacterium]